MTKKELPRGFYIVRNIFNEYCVCVEGDEVFGFSNESVRAGKTKEEAIKNYFDFIKKYKIKKEISVEEIKNKIKNLIKKYNKQWKREQEVFILGQIKGLKEILELLNKKNRR